MHDRWNASLLAAVCLAAGSRLYGGAAPEAPTAAEDWGRQIATQIQSAFYMPDRQLYAEDAGTGVRRHPAWLWDASVQLAALTAAARVEPDVYLPRVRAYAAGLRAYRTHNHDLVGLDVNPPPKPPDRYYDDNAWIVLSLLEAYELTHDPQDLQLATDAFGFVASGEDDALGGGIYWHEDDRKNKHACSCGPGMLDALRLFQVTGERKYLAAGRRLYDWTRKHLQDADGLVFDSIRVADGHINRAKFSYNSAALLRAAVLLYTTEKDTTCLEEARRIAHAAEARWVRPDGSIADDGKFAHKLIEGFLELGAADHDQHWTQVVDRCASALSQHHNEQGWYPKRWDAKPPERIDPVRLIDQSSAARAYWLAAAAADGAHRPAASHH